MYTKEKVERLNRQIVNFTQVFPITGDMNTTQSGVSRLVMLDRYTFKDIDLSTLENGDLVVLTVKEDPQFPARGVGEVVAINGEFVEVLIEEEFRGSLEGEAAETGIITKHKSAIDKPMEIVYEQIAKRNAWGLAQVEETEEKKKEWFEKFYQELKTMNFVPAGRVLYGAGAETDVTYFNCFTGDTIVQTAHYGPQKIKDLKGEYEVYSMDGEIRKADFKSFGEQDIYKVTLANGEEIKTTAGHEWFTYDRKKSKYQKVTTLELEGKKIPIVTKHLRTGDAEEYRKGIQHGVVYGDGSITPKSKSEVRLFGEKKELTKYFEEYNITPHVDDEYVRVYGMPQHYKSLPSESETNDYWHGFIVGLIATDGSCDNRGSVMIHQSSEEELQFIASNLYRTPFVHSDIRMTRELNPYNGDYAPCYALQLIKSTVTPLDLIKESHRVKFLNSPSSRKTNIEVVSVEELGYKEEVFCCEEPETNSFVIGTGYLTSNCYVMPYVRDSREGIGEHRNKVMEIMSRGGGVGTNGSTLRPRNTLARGVNGKSSGSVSWLNDIANLTNLVQQGGSRRGAQMIMLVDSHPDVLEFIISKMQNPRILRFIMETTEDEQIKQLAQDKLKFTSHAPEMIEILQAAAELGNEKAKEKLEEGGTWSVNDPEFLSGANISVCLTKEFMEAVDTDGEYELRFPDTENYNEEEMAYYNEHWVDCGDVREWEKEHKMGVRVYRTIQAKELWNLINICATYSAEPGIFFIDNANDQTNAKAYGQKVVATNPCGEQPLAPYSVCNLAAVNLAEMATFQSAEVDWEKLKHTVEVGVRMQDNVISATPYFMEENTKQALGERRVGLGVMGLSDLLIKCQKTYGAEDGNALVDEVFEVIATTAYETSVEIAKEKGSFPFLQGKDKVEELDNRLKFVKTGYMKKMPKEIRQSILKHGIRNSHLLTVAPTGSTGTMVGVSTGLEPYFALTYFRSGRLGQFIEVNAKIVEDYLEAHPEADKNNLPEYFVTAMELKPEAHADTQCVIQKWVDSSLSKTVNAPKGYTVEQVQGVYERLWRGGAKGGTVYVDGSRDAQVLSLTKGDEETEEKQEKAAPILVEDVKPLEDTSIKVGSEAGDTCPMCRKGTVEDIGGCNTCTNCNAQIKCGL